MNDSNSDPVVAEVVAGKNPFKALAIVLSILVIVLVGAIAYLLLNNLDVVTNTSTTKDNAKSYTVDLGVDALTSSEQSDTPVLTLNDLSDSFTDKYLTINEWNLKIKTKYADLLEYAFLPVTGEAGSTNFTECNGDYLQCDSVLAIRLKEKYVDVAKQQEIMDKAYGETAGTYEDKPDDRTVAYIYQDNRSLSQSGTTVVRYWSTDAFKTESGTRGTLLFEDAKKGGEDDQGFALCGLPLNITFDSSAPCEDIFLSLYRFDASSTEAN